MSENFIIGQSVSLPRVQEIAKHEGFSLFPSDDNPFLSNAKKIKFPKDLILLTDKMTDETLSQMLSLPIKSILDAQSMDDSIHDFLKMKKDEGFDGELSFLLTCPVLYACDVARIFVDALKKRLNLNDDRASDIHMALHEAIVNGLIHGNLQIGSEYRQSARLFVEYGRLLTKRLKDPAYARKSIAICACWNKSKLVIKIKDEGAGYVIKDSLYTQSFPNQHKKSGRGLLFIAGLADSCTIDDFGREMNLSFDLKAEYIQADTTQYRSDMEVQEDNHVYKRPSVNECRVLIIEDNLSNQTMLYRLLNVIGISMVECATDGIEGLKKVEQFKPDLIILDITMPRMNGYDVLHHLKSNPQTQNIPVLIETASDTREARDKTFRSGATDFITKPINPLEFFSRIKVHLENRILIKHLEKQLEQIDEELNAAQRMQRTLLPTSSNLQNIYERYGIKLTHHFEPSSRLGGDFWQAIPLSDDKLAVYICDFSGHGMSAALNTFRLHALITQMDKLSIEIPASALAMMNSQLINLLPRGQFATFFLAIIDIKRNLLTYSSAGVPRPLLLQKGQEVIVRSEGMPLGISAHAQYHNFQVPFDVGGALLLYSDALTESPDKNGDRLGEDNFAKMAINYLKEEPDSVVDAIMDKFFEFAPPPPPDDVTLIYLKREK